MTGYTYIPIILSVNPVYTTGTLGKHKNSLV